MCGCEKLGNHTHSLAQCLLWLVKERTHDRICVQRDASHPHVI